MLYQITLLALMEAPKINKEFVIKEIKFFVFLQWCAKSSGKVPTPIIHAELKGLYCPEHLN